MGEDAGGQGNEVTMQGGLLWGEGDCQGLGFAGGEAADVAAAGAVDQGRKGVKVFQLPDQGEAALGPVGGLVQPVVGLLQVGIGAKHAAAPGGGEGLAEGRTGGFLPPRPGRPRRLDGGVDVGVGLGHLLERLAVGQEVRAQEVE